MLRAKAYMVDSYKRAAPPRQAPYGRLRRERVLHALGNHVAKAYHVHGRIRRNVGRTAAHHKFIHKRKPSEIAYSASAQGPARRPIPAPQDAARYCAGRKAWPAPIIARAGVLMQPRSGHAAPRACQHSAFSSSHLAMPSSSFAPHTKSAADLTSLRPCFASRACQHSAFSSSQLAMPSSSFAPHMQFDAGLTALRPCCAARMSHVSPARSPQATSPCRHRRSRRICSLPPT